MRACVMCKIQAASFGRVRHGGDLQRQRVCQVAFRASVQSQLGPPWSSSQTILHSLPYVFNTQPHPSTVLYVYCTSASYMATWNRIAGAYRDCGLTLLAL